jgi:uncharacterized protein
MRCPACDQLLTPVTFNGTSVDVCEHGCGGVWFDQGELKRFDNPLEALERALDILTPAPEVTRDLSARRRCPKCTDSVLMRHFFSAKRAVTIDECPTCAGIWLDRGELAQIRGEFRSVEARQQAARAISEEALIDDRMAVSRRQIEAEQPFDTTWSRIPSAFLTLLYMAVAGRTVGFAAALRMGRFCVVPLVCIWWPDALGSLVRGRITRTSPRSFVWSLGWLVLLVPVFQAVIVWIGTADGR